MNKTSHTLWIVLGLHIVLWTLLSTLSRHALPADTLEGIAWGLQWQWGYDKHPFLSAWFLSGIVGLTGNVGWSVYLLGSVSIALCLWAVWRLASHVLSPRQALLAVLLLECIWYYALLAPKFDPNSLMMPLWALCALAFYQALKFLDLRYWLLAGVLAGCCLLAKYQSVVFLFCCLSVMFVTPEGRRAWRTPGPYIALVSALLMVMPNVIWLWQHDFIAWQYAAGRVGESQQLWLDHIKQPWRFVSQQLGTLSVFLIVSAYWFFAPRDKSQVVSEFDKRFFIILGLGPFLLTIMLSAIFGFYLYSKWAAPYFSLLGILLMLWLRPKISDAKLKQALVFTLCLMVGIAGVRAGYLTYFPNKARDHIIDAFYPYKTIAKTVEALAPNTQIIAGDHYLVAGLSAYLAHHPKPYFDWDKTQSPWVSDSAVNQQGAIFVWAGGKDAHPELLTRFPTMKIIKQSLFESSNPRQSTSVCLTFAKV